MLNLIRSLFNLIYAISLIYMLLDFEIKRKKDLYLMGLFVFVILICNVFVWLNFGYEGFMKLYPLLIHIPSFIVFLLVSKYKGIKLIFVLLTVFVLCSPPIGIALIISSFFGFNRTILTVVCFMMYIPTGFFVYKYLRPSFLYMLRNTDKGWFGFCTIPLSYYALIYFIVLRNSKQMTEIPNLVIMVLALILTIAAYIMILRFFKQIREQLTLQNEQNLLQMQVAAAQAHLEALEESQEKTIIYRHDMRHHLNLISAYLADNNVAAAEEYISDVENIIESTVIEKYCSNYSINLMLNCYVAKARNEHIAVETEVNLPAKNVISDMDLCVIFANAIENAINACKLVPHTDNRFIKILCKIKGDKRLIQVINSYEGTILFVDDMPASLKENHGLGTKSIAAIAEKYGGVYSFTADSGVFKTSIIL